MSKRFFMTILVAFFVLTAPTSKQQNPACITKKYIVYKLIIIQIQTFLTEIYHLIVLLLYKFTYQELYSKL